MQDKVYIFKTHDQVCLNLAKRISENINQFQRLQKIVTILLCGGNTPYKLYQMLAKETTIPWEKIHVFWSDERFVSGESIDKNYISAKVALFDNIEIPIQNIHPIKTGFATCDAAAANYEEEIRGFSGKEMPVWDINILGIGEDCHTASLFPHSKSLFEKKKWLVGVERLKPPPEGITLTFPVLNNSKYIYFLVTGENKAEAIERILKGNESVDDCPARGIEAKNGIVEWWVDKDAARLIDR